MADQNAFRTALVAAADQHIAANKQRVVAYAETRRGIQVIPPAGYYNRVDQLNAGEVIRFHGSDWTVLEVLPVEGDTGVVVIARLSGGQIRRALPFPHPAAAALVVLL